MTTRGKSAAVALSIVALWLGPIPSSSAVSRGISAPSEAPWSVPLYVNGVQDCTGSIIAPRYVLTAQHCIPGRTSWQVAVGGRRLTVAASAVTSAPSTVGDVAIMRLSEDAGVTPIRLAASQAFTDSFTGRGVTFFGWGFTSVKTDKWGNVTGYGPSATTVQKTPDGAYYKSKYCQSFNGAVPYGACFLKSKTFGQDGIAVLPGDSGGPWVAWQNGWVQIAVEHGGISEIAKSSRGPEGGASVGHSVVRNWILGIIAAPPPPTPDYCPGGDYSGSAYDGTCGTPPPTPDYCPGGDYSGNAYDGTCGTPPPSQSVSVSWGSRAPSSYCGGDTSCTYLTISWSGFGSGNHTITPYFDGQGDWCAGASCSSSLVRSGSSGSLTGYWAVGYCAQHHTITATVDSVGSNGIDTTSHGC